MPKRSYFEEVLEIENTWTTLFTSEFIDFPFDLPWLKGTAFCVGSGGTVALAKMWQLLHEEHHLGLAKVITPYDFSQSSIFPDLVVIFSASGKNHDILNAFRLAKENDCKVLIFTTTKNSSLTRLAKTQSNDTYVIYPTRPTPKDGFLAVNSVIAISGLIVSLEQKLFGTNYDSAISPVTQAIQDHKKEFINFKNGTFQIISSDWGYPAGLDFEARLAESGVGNCFLTDPRNFGHGRFIWLERKKSSTTVVFFYSKITRSFIMRYAQLLPDSIPSLFIEAPFSNIIGSIYCIVRSILIVQDLALKQQVNPGKPEVPEWGRKIHSIKYDHKKTSHLSSPYPALSEPFTSIVMDLDGTIVNTIDRFNPIKTEIILELERLLSEGAMIGIATGRGDSALKLLKKQVSEKFHKLILLGLYNGTVLMRLNEPFQVSGNLWAIRDNITNYLSENHTDLKDLKVSPSQISIRNIDKSQSISIMAEIYKHLGQYSKFMKFQESGHSLDILPHWASKLAVVQALSISIADKILCIGDQGQVGGNDEELLMWQPSISVGRLRPASNMCFWIGHNIEQQESEGLLTVLKAIYKDGKTFKVNPSLAGHK